VFQADPPTVATSRSRSTRNDFPCISRDALISDNEIQPALFERVSSYNGYAQTTTTVTLRRKRGKSEGRKSFKCPYTCCNYQGTFRRRWELQRHIATKHAGDKKFPCPVVGCSTNGQTPTFARSDKLTSHIKATHRSVGVKAICPATTCSCMPLELDLLGVHIKLCHLQKEQEGVQKMICRALANAASIGYCQCLLCKKRISLDDFPLHLSGHTTGDLDAAIPKLAEEGYIVSKLSCEHEKGSAGPIIEWCFCGMTSVEIACPMCDSRHLDRLSLKAHIEQAHVWTGENMTPFRRRILALIGMEATQVLGMEVWSDIACQLTQDI